MRFESESIERTRTAIGTSATGLVAFDLHRRQTKVSEVGFDTAVDVEDEDAAGLQVTVGEVVLVTELQSVDGLEHDALQRLLLLF